MRKAKIWESLGRDIKKLNITQVERTYGWFILLYARNQHNIWSNYLPVKNKYIF